jgi:putative hydrolase
MKGPFFHARELLRGPVPRIDLHMHTELTDGNGTLADYVARARELNLNAIAFTEHTDDTSDWFPDYVAAKASIARSAAPIEVYFGCEVKACNHDGAINVSDDRAAMADFVVGVLHSYPNGQGGYHSNKKLPPAEAQELDHRLAMALVTNPIVDVYGHPGGVYSTYFGPYNRELLREQITVAAENGKVIELNSNARYKHVFDLILETCLDLDCLVSIGSDAHDFRQLGHVIEHLDQALQRYR